MEEWWKTSPLGAALAPMLQKGLYDPTGMPPVNFDTPPPPPLGTSTPSAGVPEAIANTLATWKVGPDQLKSLMAPPPTGFGGALQPQGAPQPPIGQPGVGGEMARDAEQTALPPTAAPAAGSLGASLSKTPNPFQGLAMPTAPKPQTVSTPAAPRPSSQIKGGEIMALLQALGLGAGSGQLPPPLPSLRSVV